MTATNPQHEVTEAPSSAFRPAEQQDLRRAAWVTALAFGAPYAAKPVRRAVALLRLPWDALRLKGAYANGTLYLNGPNEFVVISSARFAAANFLPLLIAPGALFVVLVLAAWLGSVPVVISAAVFLILFALWLLLMVVPALFPWKRVQAMAAQQRLVKGSNGLSISSAAKAPKGETLEPDLGYGTLGRIAAFIEQRPELQPCFAVAAHPRYFTAYSRYMEPVGPTGLVFASRTDECAHGDNESRRDDEERRDDPTPVQGQKLIGG